jgi:Alr-MurF fusion protein
MTSSEISYIVDGRLTGKPDNQVSDIVTDSRLLSSADGLAFFAIRGKNHNGHIFIPNLYQKGVKTFIVEELPASTGNYPDAAFIKVDDTVVALQAVASFKRKKFNSPVVAVTGSAGKTIVKEWLADIAGLSIPVIRSPRSYNSQIGVPLSVWKLDDKYKLGIFEAGISMPGEMDKLRKVIDPDIGVITNIGDAHSENFPDNEIKAKEKLKLFENAGTIVYSSDQDLIHRLLRSDNTFSSKHLIDWSFTKNDAAIRVCKYALPDNRTQISMDFDGVVNDFIIPFADRASIENAITAASVCLALKTDPAIIRKGLASLVSVAMRMELKNGINNCLLIEDYYNSDPGSLGMAIEFLKHQNGRKTTLILSDFVESGRNQKELYGEVASGIRKAGIERFIGVGPSLTTNSSLFDHTSVFFYSTEEFILHFNQSDFSGEVILIKGARRFEFEKIGKLLEQQVHQTLLEVNLDAIAHNLNEFRRHLEPGTRIMAMVKAFAYGAGPAEIASLLEYHRISYLGVAYADEGVELRNAGVTLPVMVMNPDPSSYEVIIRYNLEPELYSLSSFQQFSDVASRYGLVQYPVHIKIDSGMHRLGLMPDEIDSLTTLIRDAESLKIASVFSHFAGSEDPNLDDFTHRQARIFLEAVEKIKSVTGYPFIRHICNSSGIIRFPQYQFEMVRPGIGIYGAGEFHGLNLKPAGRFKSRISQVKRIPANEPVGYGCADVSDQDREIGIVPVGYADGLNRKLGNRNGSILIRNKRVPIIGNICMDMCMVDVSGLDAHAGDEVEIFGEHIRIDELAAQCQTIPYEILTSIPARVRRVFYRE